MKVCTFSRQFQPVFKPGGTAEALGDEAVKVPLSTPRWVLVLCWELRMLGPVMNSIRWGLVSCTEVFSRGRQMFGVCGLEFAVEMLVSSSEDFQGSASQKMESAGLVVVHGDRLCLLGFRSAPDEGGNNTCTKSSEDAELGGFANTREDREVRKICRKHKGPIWKMQSKSIWRGPGNGSSTLRML